MASGTSLIGCRPRKPLTFEFRWRCAALSRSGPWNDGVCGSMQPLEVSYTTTGRSGKKERNVIGVLCPTVLAQRMGLARPIFVSLGDVEVDWSAPPSDGYRAMFDTHNAEITGG